MIFVTAGERSVACGSAKAQNLPERAKLLAVSRDKVRRRAIALAADNETANLQKLCY
ncbi:MAG: hypothetical protein LBG92_07315 [Prevotellaceae bacterium]|nr:hypothetical protein [Prevotellaceae bacterium]